jgi:flagellar assembly protein FliH
LFKIIKASRIKTVLLEAAIAPEPGTRAEDIDGMEEDTAPESNNLVRIDPDTILRLAAAQAERMETDARAQGEALVRSAQEEARAYLSQAQTEAESLKEIAFQEGYQEGCRIGKEETSLQLAAKMEPDIQRFNALLRALDEQREFFLLSQDAPILEMILSMAEKVLGTAIALKPELIQTIIKNILSALNETGKIVIKVNPVHIPYLNDHGAIFDNIDPERLQIEEDPGIKPGGCHIETEIGFVEADMDEQIELLKKVLREEAYHAGL